MYSTETTARLDHLRSKALERDLTQEEAAEVVRLIRQDRITASTVSAKSKAAKTVADPAATMAKLFAALATKK